MNIEENIIEIHQGKQMQKQFKVIHDRQLATVNRQPYHNSVVAERFRFKSNEAFENSAI